MLKDNIKAAREAKGLSQEELAIKLHAVLILLCLVIVVVTVALFLLGGQYADWNYNDPETAVLGTAAHSCEWLFVRIAPLIFLASIIGIILTLQKK